MSLPRKTRLTVPFKVKVLLKIDQTSIDEAATAFGLSESDIHEIIQELDQNPQLKQAYEESWKVQDTDESVANKELIHILRAKIREAVGHVDLESGSALGKITMAMTVMNNLDAAPCRLENMFMKYQLNELRTKIEFLTKDLRAAQQQLEAYRMREREESAEQEVQAEQEVTHQQRILELKRTKVA